MRRFAQKSHDHRGTPEVCSSTQAPLILPTFVILQKPGRVVTLIHKEDWVKFSGSVSWHLISVCHFFADVSQDAFPDEDVVWGTFN